jgi:hypothetical protein
MSMCGAAEAQQLGVPLPLGQLLTRSAHAPRMLASAGASFVAPSTNTPAPPLRALVLGATCAWLLFALMLRLPALRVASSTALQLRCVRGLTTKSVSLPSRRVSRLAVGVRCAAARSDAEKAYVAAAVDVLHKSGGGSADVALLAEALDFMGVKRPAGSVAKMLRDFPGLLKVTGSKVKLASGAAAAADGSVSTSSTTVDTYVAGVAEVLRSLGGSCKTSKLASALFAAGVKKPAGTINSRVLSCYPDIFQVSAEARDCLVTLVAQQLQPNPQQQEKETESVKPTVAALGGDKSQKRAYTTKKAATTSATTGAVVANVHQAIAAEPTQLPPQQQQSAPQEAWRAPPCFAFGIPSPHAGWAPSAGRSRAQTSYADTLASRTPYVVVVGPAGTGKTYLAVHAGAIALLSGAVQRLIITRPAVPVDEDLGFLPGSVDQKMEPYLVPILDMLSDIWPASAIQILQQERRLQVVPLGFMRGRTFDDAFILADEMQNCSRPQMHTLLTRLGVRSRLVITGDLRQADADAHTNGLRHVVERLQAALVDSGDGAAEEEQEEQAAQEDGAAPDASGEREVEAASPEALRDAVRRDFALVTLDAGSVQRNAAVQTALQLLA